jgi:protocatechuate 3,4-dioxygenase beta subunit
MKQFLFTIATGLLFIGLAATPTIASESYRCTPTRPDGDGPFYRAGAPERSKVGVGYQINGTVRSALNCAPLADAKIEIWLNGPDSRYGDPWWATIYANTDGGYHFESHLPVPYGSRPPHIHIIVNAAGYDELVTQHYPFNGATSAVYDLVLIPE